MDPFYERRLLDVQNGLRPLQTTVIIYFLLQLNNCHLSSTSYEMLSFHET